MILKISDTVKFTLLNTKIIFHKLIFLNFFLCYETTTLSTGMKCRIPENSRSNLNSKFALFKDPVHWVGCKIF